MPDKSQLPFLLKLLEDPAPRVRDKVRAALHGFGSGLRREIERGGFNLNDAQRAALDEICADHDVEYADFAELWLSVQSSDDEWFKLESAFAFLARWQFELEGDSAPYPSLRALLNDLAHEYRRSEGEGDALALADWLFGARGLGGATPDSYYSPLNCNLTHVLQTGQGLPLSLAAIFMLVGQRLDIDVHGVSFPSHFLARSGRTFFDCYNGGRILSRKESSAIIKVMPDALLPSSAAPIIARALLNLVNAYQSNDEYEKARQCLALLEQFKQLETAI